MSVIDNTFSIGRSISRQTVTNVSFYEDDEVVGQSQPRSRSETYLNRHKKELTTFGAVFLMVVAFIGVIFYTDPTGVIAATHWMSEPWVQTTCSVQDIGIAYRGNCKTDAILTMQEKTHFEECGVSAEDGQTDDELRLIWKHSQAGRCAQKGNMYYGGGDPSLEQEHQEPSPQRADGDNRAAPPQLLDVSAKTDAPSPPALGVAPVPPPPPRVDIDKPSLPALGAPTTPPRQLALYHYKRSTTVTDIFRSFNPPNQLECYNSYLPWALLKVHVNSSGGHIQGKTIHRCGYQFGAAIASVRTTWDQVDQTLHKLHAKRRQGSVKCWVLGSDNCVVTFDDQKRLGEKELRNHEMFLSTGAICGALAILATFLACAWHHLESGVMAFFGVEPPGSGYHVALPTSDPDVETQISDRVRTIMDITGGRIEDDTPPVSGESTLRTGKASHRTIEIVGLNGVLSSVPRNVAADFLKEGRK